MDVYRNLVASLRVTMCMLSLCLASGRAYSTPNVLNLTSHADTFIAPAINATVGSGVVDTAIYVDYDTSTALADLTHPSDSTFSVASGVQVSHLPYGVANLSTCCSKGAGDDVFYYKVLHDSNAILSTPGAFAVGGPLPEGTAPPTSNTATSSTNSSNGGTGWGIEFGLSAGYLGLDTTADSWNSAAMAGFLAVLGYQHPGWTWFDVKAALRQTASHWVAGYSHTAFGYGLVDFSAANAITGPGALYLQPPGLQITMTESAVNMTLYPFRQSRRHHEAIYSINPNYSWPTGRNELTGADLAAAAAVLLYSSNGTDVIPTPSIPRPTGGPMWIVAFTTDGLGNYSRIEEFSARRVEGLGTVDVPLPVWASFVLTSSLLAIAAADASDT
jgi:hypothetical protein